MLKSIVLEWTQTPDQQLNTSCEDCAANTRKNSRETTSISTSKAELRKCFIHNAVPFVGFGFLDNFIMLIAGDAIESYFGTYFHISVLAAAGLGNTLSDTIGIVTGGYIELLADRMGLPKPVFTAQEEDSHEARYAKTGGQMVGIIVGCIIGMCPLLFLDTGKYNRPEDPPLATAPFQ